MRIAAQHVARYVHRGPTKYLGGKLRALRYAKPKFTPAPPLAGYVQVRYVPVHADSGSTSSGPTYCTTVLYRSTVLSRTPATNGR